MAADIFDFEMATQFSKRNFLTKLPHTKMEVGDSLIFQAIMYTTHKHLRRQLSWIVKWQPKFQKELFLCLDVATHKYGS